MSALPKFAVGQHVVAIEDHPGQAFAKGDRFVITGLERGCCYWSVTIGIPVGHRARIFGGQYSGYTECSACRALRCRPSGEALFNEARFAPIHENFERITFEKVIEQEAVAAN